MGSVNVNRNVTDAFYRYKMPRIQAKVEGKGNGIKTVIVNMTDVAKAIGRPPTYPTKFFGCELGAQTQFDFKNDRYIVNGSHDALKLQNLLDGFIKKFVLCPECENPETNLIINQKKQIISRGCKACGYQSMLDMKHKLTTFILKNPPDVNPAATGSSLATPSKGKSKKRKEAAKLSKTNGEDPNGSPDKGSDPEANNEGEDGEDDDWAVDVSQEAVMKRMQDLTEGAKNLTFTDDLEKTEKERVDIFYEFLQKKKRQNGVVGAHKEILNESERLEIREKAPLVISEVLFGQDILQSIRAYRVLLLCFTHQNKRAQKALLGGVEQIINLQQDALLPKVPHILKALYDNDIVEEEVFLDWGKKVSKKYVGKELAAQIHSKAEPFLKWLQEAEEEEDSSDEESDVEIDYDDRLKATTLQEQPRARDKSPPADEQHNQKKDDDEIDIDAI